MEEKRMNFLVARGVCVMNPKVLKHWSFDQCLWACSIHMHFGIQNFDTRVEFNMFLAFVGIERPKMK